MKRALVALSILAALVLFMTPQVGAIYSCDYEAVMRWYPDSGWVCIHSDAAGEVCILCEETIDVPYTP